MNSDEHREGIWIPGARFEATVDADRTVAEIYDRELYGRLNGLDSAGLRELITTIVAIKTSMHQWKKSGTHTWGRFQGFVSINLKRADIRDNAPPDPKKRTIIALKPEDVDELHELATVLLETLEVEPV
jgi:hypothetical protein